MTSIRFIPLAVSIAAAGLLAGCTTAPAMPMGGGGHSMAMHSPDQMARMDAHMKSMQAMHEKMMAAKTPEERNALMAAHMKSMQDGMAMMKEMPAQGMRGMPGMTAEMSARHQMMDKRMDMMQSMMEMMMDRMPAAPAPAR
jgi:hypothetical protein